MATIECHDLYRSRAMVGKEADPKYWFADESFQQAYISKIWWRRQAFHQAGARDDSGRAVRI
ncbi:MAG: hypothetical protein WD294_01410 [Phycisphaeraceae bacterium]